MWKYTNGSVFVLFVIWTQLVVNIELVATNLIPPPAQPCDRTRRVFTEAYGEISDGPNGSNYTQDSHCEWLIKAKNDSQFITLTFHSMGTECSYDYIFVYDGDSFKSPLLGSFSGRTDPQKVIATSGSMLILLYSDTNYVLDGFKAEFYVSNCPNNCTNQGKCINHQCVCQGDWIGKDCGLHACPENCGVTQGRGVCSKEHCRCLNGYAGKSCSLHNHHPEMNEWHWMSTFQGGLWPRAAHTAVYVNETDSLYVFGGYDLNNVLGSLQIYRFNKSTWEDEWGINLRSRHFPKEIDNALIKAVLHEDEDEARLWGLKNDASFFRNILLTISNQNFNPRKQRSPSRNETPHDLTDFLEEYTDKPRPKDRYGHASSLVDGGFVIFGGKLGDGTLSNELWFYNVTHNGGQWEQRATNSTIYPPPLTRHTLTKVTSGDDSLLYVFGGSLMNGEFSSRLFKLQIKSDPSSEQWEEVFPRGGKALDVRVVAHTTIYHKFSNSLIVYGGVVAGVARFSKLSDRMFAFHIDERHWTELQYPRTPLRDAYIPRERAFHTATAIGNYMIVFGGYSHRHNKEEICYDNQMYLYHLGCHTWINQDVLGTGNRSTYPKQQGVFAHAATVRNGNSLFIVGGYHGNVNADMLAYTLPAMLLVGDESQFDPEAVCPKHTSVSECLSDPECGWCSADGWCYGRTIGANCTTNLQTTRCPGICPALGDCHSCLIHGSGDNRESSHSISNKFGLNQCTWCVQNARCHHKDDNYGVCGEETPSQVPGWWGSKGTEVISAMQCTELDRRPGLTFLKYLAPVNWTMPDDVRVINATMVDFMIPSSTTHTEQGLNGEIVARLLGFIRPPKIWKDAAEILHVCASYSHAVLRLGQNGEDLKVAANISFDQNQCVLASWPNLENRIVVDFQAKRTFENGAGSHYQHSKMGLQHNGSHENARAFTFEYLEPFSSGNCAEYMNCAHCLADSACGWCELNDQCISRSENEQESCSMNGDWRYLTIQPSKCANCSNYISCHQCVEPGYCEWWAEDARCARIGRSPSAVRESDQCPAPCYSRANCSACLEERGRCVWCESTMQCFSFSVYTSEYQFGTCREWLDQTSPFSYAHDHVDHHQAPVQQCKSCATHTNCSTCLKSLSCGWCFDRDNPIEGVCMQGNFNRSTHDCAAALNAREDEAEWAYATCPDVDECGLKLHDCHKEAKCTNTHGSYSCHCRRGFIGDGRTSCVRTCFEQCIHGHCSGSPDYKCNCNLGWTGVDCSINCGCNNHSTCETELGKCDKCQNWTEGDFCEQCRPGSYGNATSSEGCKPCECNGHGNQALGICDVTTGDCFCQDNTEGLKCEMCNKNFYGEPKEGGQCYFQCEARGMLKDLGKQGIGSRQSKPDTSECLWIVSPHAPSGAVLNDSLIQLEIEEVDLNVPCGENAIYVYDGLPDLIGNTQQRQLLAVFCSEDTKPFTVEARSGHLTVHYKKQRGELGFGFNAMYTVRSCSFETCLPPHVCNDKNQCVCLDRFTGPKCELEQCPKNCSSEIGQGHCDKAYGRCICSPGYGNVDCSQRIRSQNLVISELFNSQLLSESVEHLRKTLPRFGHSLVSDKRGSLWMFGGYSLSHGPLNDIRLFDTKDNTWMQVTVDSTPEAKMPEGRYFHAADILHSKQIIYVYGGLTGKGKGYNNMVLGDCWMFSLVNQRWDEVLTKDEDMIAENQPPPLAGHTLTLVKDSFHEGLMLIGGFSPENGLNPNFYEFNITTSTWSIHKTSGHGPTGIYGHSSIYHVQSQVVYVFGGYEYAVNDEHVSISNRLYAFDYAKKSWTELPSFKDLNRPEEFLPRARFLHSAVATDNYMVVFGGRTNPVNSSDVLIAYVYKCNQWVRLTEDVETIGRMPPPTYAQAMTLDQETDSIYVVGGWDGSSQSRVTRIDLPNDLCELWSSGKYLCRHFMGCSFCSVKPLYDNASHCYSNNRSSEVCDGHNGTLVYNHGASCDNEWMLKRNCSAFDSCTSCLATWPTHPEQKPACQWCDGCERGKCISTNEECKPWGKYCSTEYLATVSVVDSCRSKSCFANDCQDCKKRNVECEWSQNHGDWSCTHMHMIGPSNAVTKCEERCHVHQNCSSCLEATSIDGGFVDCRWSTQLNECISPSYQSIYCTGGVCGLVLLPNDINHCPEPCNAFTQCSTCLRHSHCGWCSRNGTEGDGICTEGSVDAPAVSTCDIIYSSLNNVTDTAVDVVEAFMWNFWRCPPENECINNHHSCDLKSERCVDLLKGYECECGDGYKSDGKKCIPICEQGCVRGQCVEPNVCECNFGYVGANCSIACECNGHSDCRGPDKLDECIQCFNNTIGAKCEKCKPLYVGDPRNNGECKRCLDYCNGHTEVCVGRDQSLRNLSKEEIENYLDEGPMDDAVCLRCANQTANDRCESCIVGHFRGTDDFKVACRPCQCHGHGDTCDPITGEKCNCGNNTESDATCSATSSKNSAQQCWMVQCSKCRDSYAGNPIDGHQCYKQITVESKMCFDAKTIDECKKPQPLRPGQTVFFVIQPRFMNVDIRIIIDVTQGELDLFMSPQDDSFVVLPNQTTGDQDIYLDSRYIWFPENQAELIESIGTSPSRFEYDNGTSDELREDSGPFRPHILDCHPLIMQGFSVKDKHAKDLSTYVTLNNCNTLLRVYSLQNRLVLTVPQTAHNLSATRFFIALRARSGVASYGLVFFRQDQLHIDLFVFFSVFFSCFFLFLAVCVVAWKTKQAADIRRARRRHVVEMLHMAKRPFASITILLGPGSNSPAQMRRRGRSKPTLPEVRPIAVETTADGAAAVGTVFVRLPGTSKSPVSLALGSSLTVMSRQAPSSSRIFLRRRGSNHQPIPQVPPSQLQQQHAMPMN